MDTLQARADMTQLVLEGRLTDPFGFFGLHLEAGSLHIRTFQPGATAVTMRERVSRKVLCELGQVGETGLFAGIADEIAAYFFEINWGNATQETEDVYSFGVLLTEEELRAFSSGTNYDLAETLGAEAQTIDGIRGVRFAVWAPNATRVSVVGDFNTWDGRRHGMRLRHQAGVWEIFIPRLLPGTLYKYEILDRAGHVLPHRADPVATYAELPPATASIVADLRSFSWRDGPWMQDRALRQSRKSPMSIYEVHSASWFRPEGRVPTWRELGDRLIPYVVEMGFTHVEFLPIMEHPFSGSWGYQPLGLFAPTSRHGDYRDFARLVDRFHEASIGVILDWVPGHFPNDAHGPGYFDGTHLYEHADPREGLHRDWNTLIYNFGRQEVRAFLISSALHWLNHYHIDGLRVDAVASMLYRDYSRQPGEWIPNKYGGNANLEAISFMQELTSVIETRFPDTLVIAEESTAWPQVTTRSAEGGLGFTHKWNMGWMNDTLRYVSKDPIYRKYQHNDMTFGLLYGFTEKFVLPLSHDEVVHGKKSIFGRMPGDHWQRFATMRAYLAFMWGHPGKKLIFMGTELAQQTEWNHDRELDWALLDDGQHKAVQIMVRELNRLHRELPALHQLDHTADGFTWIVREDVEQSVFVFLRLANEAAPVLVVCNFTPVPRFGYRVGVPTAGRWREVFNSDSELFGGSDIGNGGGADAISASMHGYPDSLSLTIPPLGTIFLEGHPIANVTKAG